MRQREKASALPYPAFLTDDQIKAAESEVKELRALGDADDYGSAIVLDWVKANPGDPQYMRTRWLVLRAAKHYKDAVAAGQAYAAADPTVADSSYYLRMIADYGVRGFKFHPPIQNFNPNDPMAWPIYEVIAEHKLPAIFHTGHSGMGTGMRIGRASEPRLGACAAPHGGCRAAQAWKPAKGRRSRAMPWVRFGRSRPGCRTEAAADGAARWWPSSL